MARTRTEERMGETYGEASEGRNQATSNRAPAGGGAPRLPKQPKIEQITEAMILHSQVMPQQILQQHTNQNHQKL